MDAAIPAKAFFCLSAISSPCRRDVSAVEPGEDSVCEPVWARKTGLMQTEKAATDRSAKDKWPIIRLQGTLKNPRKQFPSADVQYETPVRTGWAGAVFERHLMDVSSIGRAESGTTAGGQTDSVQQDRARDAFTAARKLNALNITDREFTVVRDPSSQRFKIVVLDGSTGAVLDQIPAEDILQMLAQLSTAGVKSTGEGQE